VVNGAFSGDAERMDSNMRRLIEEGTPIHVLLTAALNHAVQLLAARLETESGKSPEAVLSSWKPQLFFKRKDAVRLQLGRWNTRALKQVIRLLDETLLESRRRGTLADTVASRALLQIAAMNRSTGRSGVRP
jgi:DNA polymerase-3 subunit delta